MKAKPRKPTIPRTERASTRQALTALLRERSFSAKDLSAKVRIEEKEVYGHLEHIRRTLHATGGFLEVTPARCSRCGFEFRKRGRLTAPGKCPVCRHEAILDPIFAIRSI